MYREKLKLFVLVASIFMVGVSQAQTPREQLNQMKQELSTMPAGSGRDALRERILKLAAGIKPAPAVPPEAERFEGRAQYAFKNAKSEAELLDAAREYDKAIAAAPWVAGYYFDVCTILEKAGRPSEAMRACKFYLVAASDAPDAGEVRKRIAGLEYAVEKTGGEEVNGKDGAPMMLVPDGEFLYGLKERRSLSAFYMDKYETSTRLYAAFLQTTGREKPKYWNEVRLTSHGDRPVIGVTWHDADAYCRHYGKRLPTEEEWEKAARGTDGRKYPWGNDEPTSRHANFSNSSSGQYDLLLNVGTLEDGKSPYGIYDMAGNVWEWTSSNHYFDSRHKISKGGSLEEPAFMVVSHFANISNPSYRFKFQGFRCAQDAS